ncbi:hypothetical protein HK104_008782, partial [Borealophlyctis nickersoniae]
MTGDCDNEAVPAVSPDSDDEVDEPDPPKVLLHAYPPGFWDDPYAGSQRKCTSEEFAAKPKVAQLSARLRRRLQFAHYKVRNGWQNMSFDQVDRMVEEQALMKRKDAAASTIARRRMRSSLDNAGSVRNCSALGLIFGSGSSRSGTGPCNGGKDELCDYQAE